MSESFWAGRRVFVTGATGFVGAHLTSDLVQRRAEVVCLQRDAPTVNSLDLLGMRAQVCVVNGAVEDLSFLQRVLNQYEIEVVFHLAAQALVVTANRSPLSTFESNIRGTYCLLEACRQSPTVKSTVVASSDKAYGSQAELPYRETNSLLGLFPYDASKACTDILARSFAHTYGSPVAVARFANVYGPADTNLSRIIPGTIVSVLKGEEPIIRSDGTPVREFVYIDDTINGYLALAERINETQGEAFNFGTGEHVQILDLTNRIIRLAGKEGQLMPKVLLKDKIPGEIDAQYLSSDKVRNCVGWSEQVNLDEGLRRSIAWYKSNLSRLALPSATET
jgi:CDP-glucose 4,6-dehydratase